MTVCINVKDEFRTAEQIAEAKSLVAIRRAETLASLLETVQEANANAWETLEAYTELQSMFDRIKIIIKSA